MPSLTCQQLRQKALVAIDEWTKAFIAASENSIKASNYLATLKSGVNPNSIAAFESYASGCINPIRVQSDGILRTNIKASTKEATAHFNTKFYPTRKEQILKLICGANSSCRSSKTNVAKNYMLYVFLNWFYITKYQILRAKAQVYINDHNQNPCSPPLKIGI